MSQKHEIYGYFFTVFRKNIYIKYSTGNEDEDENELSLRQQQLQVIM